MRSMINTSRSCMRCRIFTSLHTTCQASNRGPRCSSMLYIICTPLRLMKYCNTGSLVVLSSGLRSTQTSAIREPSKSLRSTSSNDRTYHMISTRPLFKLSFLFANLCISFHGCVLQMLLLFKAWPYYGWLEKRMV